MITDDDLKKLITAFSHTFVTKQDFEHMEGKFSEYRQEVLERLDKGVTEIFKNREERIAHSFQHDEMEKRLKDIESIPTIAHSINK